MIRINLIAGRAAVSAAAPSLVLEGDIGLSGAETQKQAFLRLILIAFFPLLLVLHEQTTLPELVSTRNQKAQSLEELRKYNSKKEASVIEIKNFKEDEARIQARISSLEKLSKERQREIRVLDLIQQVIPEKVWLTKVVAADGRLTISGMAMSDFDISGFMESLAKSVFFIDVNLLNSADTVFDGLNLKRFDIQCMMERKAL